MANKNQTEPKQDRMKALRNNRVSHNDHIINTENENDKDKRTKRLVFFYLRLTSHLNAKQLWFRRRQGATRPQCLCRMMMCIILFGILLAATAAAIDLLGMYLERGTSSILKLERIF